MPVNKTIDQHFQIYRSYLLGLKPTANVDTTDSDWWIRGRTVAGVASGLSTDIEKVGQDAFPQSARREALLRHIFAYFAENNFKPATVASGPMLVTGDALAGPFTAGLQATHAQSGNVYVTTEDFSLNASGEGSVNVQSILAGQSQNLQTGAELAIGSPPSGLDSTGIVGTGGISDGTNEETEELAAFSIHYEGASITCEGCDTEIESAYGDPGEEDEDFTEETLSAIASGEACEECGQKYSQESLDGGRCYCGAMICAIHKGEE